MKAEANAARKITKTKTSKIVQKTKTLGKAAALVSGGGAASLQRKITNAMLINSTVNRMMT